MSKTNSSKCTTYSFSVSYQVPVPSIHPVWPTRKATEWHKNIVQDWFRRVQTRAEKRCWNERQWLRSYIALKVRPLARDATLNTTYGSQLCVFHLHKTAFQLTNIHFLVHLLCLCSLAAWFSCLWPLVSYATHTDCDFLLPSHPMTNGLPLLFVRFTLVGRQCSRAVTNKTHSSSIPLF